jgi:hypothetical protein
MSDMLGGERSHISGRAIRRRIVRPQEIGKEQSFTQIPIGHRISGMDRPQVLKGSTDAWIPRVLMSLM